MEIIRTVKIDNSELEIRVVGNEEDPFFVAKDVISVLGLSNVSGNLKNIPSKWKHFDFLNTKGGRQKMSLLSEEGLKYLLSKTRSPHVDKVSSLFDLKVVSLYECKEASVTKTLLKAFDGETIEFQKVVGKYRIDVYFPNYRLAVEIDEHDHDDRDVLYEEKRQAFLEKKLNCEFIRVNPDDPGFNVLSVVNMVFRHMKFFMKNN